jgi:hypothetical protein
VANAFGKDLPLDYLTTAAGTWFRVPAADHARVVQSDLPFEQSRGRRECRVKASPMARLQQKTQAAVTTGSANIRHSLRDGFNPYT